MDMDEAQGIISRLANVEYRTIPTEFSFVREFDQVISLLAPVLPLKELTRIGRLGDGGYVVENEFTSKIIKRAINLGVGMEFSADLHLLDLNFNILAIDGTVTNPIPFDDRYIFIQKNIGYIKGNQLPPATSYLDLIREADWSPEIDLLLIDIEGSEYGLLSREIETLQHARQIVIEFHGLELLGDEFFMNFFIEVLQKLRLTHSPIHIHGNNSGNGIFMAGCEWPTILEVTFLKKEFCTSKRNYGPFPSVNDYPNSSARPDIELNSFFSESPNFLRLSRNIMKDWEAIQAFMRQRFTTQN